MAKSIEYGIRGTSEKVVKYGVVKTGSGSVKYAKISTPNSDFDRRKDIGHSPEVNPNP